MWRSIGMHCADRRNRRTAYDGYAISTGRSTISAHPHHTGEGEILIPSATQRPVLRRPVPRSRADSPIAQIRANDRDRGPARYREQIAERKAREEAGERDGWGPGGYKWRQWDHLKEERRRTEIEIQGRASVADLYE